MHLYKYAFVQVSCMPLNRAHLKSFTMNVSKNDHIPNRGREWKPVAMLFFYEKLPYIGFANSLAMLEMQVKLRMGTRKNAVVMSVYQLGHCTAEHAEG